MTFENLINIINDRKNKRPEGSYIASLFEKGDDRIAQKVGEEAVEVVIASKNDDKPRLVSELADLWFHILILMVNKNVSFDEIKKELEKRHKPGK